MTLNVGSRSQVCINPGPNGAFQISFKTEEDGVENRLLLSIHDGQCNISSDSALKLCTAEKPPEVPKEEEVPVQKKLGIRDVYASLYKKVE